MPAEVCQLNQLQGPDYTVIQHAGDIQDIATEHLVDMPGITGMVVRSTSCEIDELWVSESAQPFQCDAPYFRALVKSVPSPCACPARTVIL